MNVLLTGGLGFIGSNLVKELEKRDYDVWTCDLVHSDREKHVRCDVSKHRQVERLFEEHDFDYVYHAAAEYGGDFLGARNHTKLCREKYQMPSMELCCKRTPSDLQKSCQKRAENRPYIIFKTSKALG